MPWEAILGGATGGVAIAIVVSVFVLKSVSTTVVEAAEKRFESTLKRAEDLQASVLALASTVDTDLRARRIAAYSELWKKTGALPQWPRNDKLTYQDLRYLTADFRRWYFEVGGMYLSTTSWKAYAHVQALLTELLSTPKEGAVRDDYDSVRVACSALRTELTRDLLSRREAPELSPSGRADR